MPLKKGEVFVPQKGTSVCPLERNKCLSSKKGQVFVPQKGTSCCPPKRYKCSSYIGLQSQSFETEIKPITQQCTHTMAVHGKLYAVYLVLQAISCQQLVILYSGQRDWSKNKGEVCQVRDRVMVDVLVDHCRQLPRSGRVPCGWTSRHLLRAQVIQLMELVILEIRQYGNNYQEMYKKRVMPCILIVVLCGSVWVISLWWSIAGFMHVLRVFIHK